ncbi:DMT family transporter [Gulosibacter sp. ACHW.36C]|uniref:DMT family transporter n=1 Tax=Gulosibacter sediminis TaxID=1729695 RepID=A0ABY4MWZ4_9MICO|nr:DMT family transporter [Gulosibacter sediminis]UQN14940.1 DMT family transporter [Gulosibacter sediminis]
MAVGICSATQARVNGSLGASIASGVHAATISFLVGLLVLILITLLVPSAKRGLGSVVRAVRTRHLPWYGLGGGVLGAVFVLAQGVAVPTLGVAMFMTSMVLGQLLGSLLVDATGFLGAPKRNLSVFRVAGAILTGIAVVVIGLGTELTLAALPLLVLGVFAGACVSLQMAVTGLVNVHSGEAVAPGLINFFVGAVVLALAAVLAQAAGWVAPAPLPGADEWYLYVGGALGVLYLIVVAAVVRHLGVFLLTLSVVAGQLIGALLFDLAAGHVSILVLVGVPLAFLGIVVANLSTFRRPGN